MSVHNEFKQRLQLTKNTFIHSFIETVIIYLLYLFIYIYLFVYKSFSKYVIFKSGLMPLYSFIPWGKIIDLCDTKLSILFCTYFPQVYTVRFFVLHFLIFLTVGSVVTDKCSYLLFIRQHGFL